MNTRKPEHRKGMIQLIDASGLKTSLRKNQGNKRYEISEEDRKWIIQTYIDGHDHGNSVLVPAETFMYRKVTTQRPLRAAIVLSDEGIEKVSNAFPSRPAEFKTALKQALLNLRKTKEQYLLSESKALAKEALEQISSEILPTRGKTEASRAAYKSSDVTILTRSIEEHCTVKDPAFPLSYDRKNNIIPDPDLKDTENIPFGTSFEKYLETEVLPFAPETWIDESVLDKGPLQDGQVGVVGTNISFNRFFYHYEEPRKPEDIAAEIRALEKSLDGFMEGLLG